MRWLLLCGLLGLCQAFKTVLVAPVTPFNSDGSLNPDPDLIDAQAKYIANNGATLVWVMGSMGEFDQLTMDERKTLAKIWIPAGEKYGLQVVINVGDATLAVAKELAIYVATLKPFGIAAVPPFYHTPKTNDELVASMAEVFGAVPDSRVLYYHIPGMTHVDLPMLPFLQSAIGEGKIPNLYGIKYVDATNDDYFKCVREFPQIDVMWAPEPKLAGAGLGASSYVVAESYFAPVMNRFMDAWNAGNLTGARDAQFWKDTVSPVISAAGDGHQRCIVGQMIGHDFGPNRLPLGSLDASQCEQLVATLKADGYWKGMMN